MFKKRSQAASTDLFMAVFVFIILITAIISCWNLYNKQINERLIYEYMIVNAFQVSDLLVKSRGTPLEWNSTNVDTVGLAVNDRHISSQKLSSFNNITYDTLKNLFNIERYEFYFQINYPNRTMRDSYGGEFNGTYSVNIRRHVMYENEKTTIDFKLWK